MVSSALWADVAIPNDNAKAESCLEPAHVLPVEKHSGTPYAKVSK
jgi:hypothetical protein